MKRILVVMIVAGLTTGVAALLWPAPATALGGSDMETNFYQCPENHTSLAQCQWTGMVLRDCANNVIIEGTQGNYKVTYSQSCNTPAESMSCFYLIIQCVTTNGITTCTPLWWQASCLN